MERGLLWLPLLITFFALAWLGWNEYQKIETYQKWAQQFTQAKYDIYAVLGYQDQEITWGKATRKGMINLQRFSLTDVENIDLLVNDEIITSQELPQKGQAFIQFKLKNSANIIKIPFTQIDLASQWTAYLKSKQ
jgi:hypothetical protein